MHAKHIRDYLASDQATGRWVSQVTTVLTLRQHLASVLPDSLQRACVIANYKHGIVVLLVGSNAAAAKLRLLEPRLLAALGKAGVHVTGFKIQIQAGVSFPVQVLAKKALSLSAEAAEALAKLSSDLPEGALRRAVVALAKRRE